MQSAQTLFYKDGVRSTGVDRLILEAEVTKVTFYRHFPSKSDLIHAYLTQRHDVWIAWFKKSLRSAPASQSARGRLFLPLRPLYEVAHAWFNEPNFNGCAFANTILEVGDCVPSIIPIAMAHKDEVRDAIAELLPQGSMTSEVAWAATIAFDGAIVSARAGGASVTAALRGLESLLKALENDYRRRLHSRSRRRSRPK